MLGNKLKLNTCLLIIIQIKYIMNKFDMRMNWVMELFSKIENTIANKIGLSIFEIKDYSPEKFRSHLEISKKKPFSFSSEFPVIGRGNVLRENIQDSNFINKEIRKILG